MDTIPLLIILLGGFVAFAFFWSFVVWLISRMAGWSKLAERYPSRQPWNETCWRMQSARIGWSNYSGVLNVCADAEGIHISAILPFSMGHTPFSVPWSEISGQERKRFVASIVELRFQRVPDVPVQITVALANRLAEASSGAWQYEAA